MIQTFLKIFLILYSSLVFSQDFRASLRGEKSNLDNDWSEWAYNGASFRIKGEKTITIDDNEIKTEYKILKVENEDSYEGFPANVISLKCEGPNLELIEVKIVDKGLNFLEDRKNKKFKLDRHRIYIHKQNKKYRYNVYLLVW